MGQDSSAKTETKAVSWPTIENDPELVQEFYLKLFGVAVQTTFICDPSHVQDQWTICIFDYYYDRQLLYKLFQPYDGAGYQLIKQTIDNSCFTVALLNVFVNSKQAPQQNSHVLDQVLLQASIENIQELKTLHYYLADEAIPRQDKKARKREDKKKDEEPVASGYYNHYVVLRQIADSLLLFDGYLQTVQVLKPEFTIDDVVKQFQIEEGQVFEMLGVAF